MPARSPSRLRSRACTGSTRLRDLAVRRARVDPVVEAEAGRARPRRDRRSVLCETGSGDAGRVGGGAPARPSPGLSVHGAPGRGRGRGVHRVVRLAGVRRADAAEERTQRPVGHAQAGPGCDIEDQPPKRDGVGPDLAGGADLEVDEVFLRPVAPRVDDVQHAVPGTREPRLGEVDHRARESRPLAARAALARCEAMARTMSEATRTRRVVMRRFSQTAFMSSSGRIQASSEATESFAVTGGRSSRHVHCAASLSSRKRMSFVPCRKRFDCTLS